jgi:hypothetical protein
MKKAFILTGAIMMAMAAHAGDDNNLETNFNAFRNISFVMDLQRICTFITILALLLAFILTVIRLFLDQRIKHSLIDKGASENIIAQLLPTVQKDNRHVAMKWFFILAGIGLGLTLISIFLPLGIHSLAMMAFSLSASFLGYYYFSRRAGK